VFVSFCPREIETRAACKMLPRLTAVVETQKIQGPDGKMRFVKKVVGFSDDSLPYRKFAVDMAGFAVNVNFLASIENASMPYKAGYEEDYFIQSLNVTFDDLEPLANGCTQVVMTQSVSWTLDPDPGPDPDPNPAPSPNKT